MFEQPDPVQAARAVDDLKSAVECLRDIATGRKSAEAAEQWLVQHGYAVEGGYVPGAQGFGDVP